MIWFPALVGALMVGGSLGRSLSQGSDVTGLDKISPESSSAMKYYITGIRDKEGHWTEEVKIEHGDEDWHVDVDHATLEEELGQPKVKITATFSAKIKTPEVKGVVEAKQDKGWVYKLYPKSHLDWFGAEVKCEEWGGHLAIPDTKEKLQKLMRILQAHIKETGEATAVYLGFTDIKEEGNFVTVLGEPMFSTQDSAWSPPWYRSDQPDDDKSWSKDGEDCGSLRSSGGLNDIPCRYSLPFICERERGIEDAVDEEETITPAETGDKDEDSLQLFPHSAKDWYEAKEACVEWGGHLAIPDSEEKMWKMKKMLNSPTKNPDLSGAFLGFDDIKKEGEFVTIFGKPVFNSNGQWSPHWFESAQPDDDKDWTTEGEDCGSMRPNGGLNDVPCRYHLPYFCEKNSKIVDSQEPGDDYEFPHSLGSSFYQTEEDYDLDMSEEKKDEDDDGALKLFTRSDLNWFEANDACQVWGGSLAEPDTREKVETMSLKMKVARIEAAFLGFGDQEKEGYFVTISGAPVFDPSSWSPSWFSSDQPDDDKEWSKEGEDCGSIRSGGGLNDVPCKYHLPYFCQKSMPVEEPRDEDDALTTDTTSPATSDDVSHLVESDDSTSSKEEPLNIEIATLKTTSDDVLHLVESDDSTSSKEEPLNAEIATLTTSDEDSHLVESDEKSSSEDEALLADTSSPATSDEDLDSDEMSSSKEQAVMVNLTLDDDSTEDSNDGRIIILPSETDSSKEYYALRYG